MKRWWLCLCLGALLGISGCRRAATVKAEFARLEKTFPGGTTNAYLNLVRSAVRSNDPVGSVVALQSLQRMPGATAQQLQAVQRTMQAITADLVNRADRGDPQAKAGLAVIEKTRSQ